MGFLSKVSEIQRRFGRRKPALSIVPRTSQRVCQVEALEPRRLLAADIRLGATYYEDSTGFDEAGDDFEITWNGGAAGTQLTQLRIETDKENNGLTIGDTFFDIAAGGAGAFQAFGLSITSHDGFQITSFSVEDGGMVLVLNFSGFDAGEKLKFSVDVDEQGFLGANAVAEGNEFEGSRLIGTFAAPHFHDVTKSGIFFDAYDPNFAGSGLNLPQDNYNPPNNMPTPVRTAGAIVTMQQVPLPITIAGTVYEDHNLNNAQDAGDSGIGNVQLTLFAYNGSAYVTTGITVTTNASGHYKFENVLPGQYRVVETQPGGYFSVGSTIGNVNGTTRGLVTSVDVLSDINLLGGENSVKNNFAEATPAKLSGHVYHDVDNDGNREAGENGIGNVTIAVDRLVNGSVVETVTVTTDASGYWQAIGLRPGNYRVRETQPGGYLDGKDKAGNAGGSAVNPGDLINGIFLGSAQHGENYDFGELVPGKISGRVHADLDGDCEYDPGEATIAGVTIQLLNSNGDVIATTTTNADGKYEFTGLAPGTYGIRELQPAGYFDGGEKVGSLGGTKTVNDTIGAIVVGSGDNGVNYDFCEKLPVTIAGHVYVDDNNNGIRDPGEVGIAGVTVVLLGGNGQSLGVTTTTNANGEYEFTGLAPGTYGVSENQPTGYFDGLDTAGTAGGNATNPGDIITGAVLTSGMHGKQYNFGELRAASIKGLVHADKDGDCTYDPGEPLLAGVVIELLNSQGQVIATTTTDANGEYKFENLAPGTYGVHEVQPVDYWDGGEKVGSAGGTVTGDDLITQIHLGSGTNGVNYNFCEKEFASLAGSVYVDVNNNGLRDPGEAGIAGVVLALVDANGNPTGKTATTNANGEYIFNKLPPGVYGVIETQPAGYFDGLDSAGTAGGTATNPGDKILGATLTAGLHAKKYDFGELVPASISGRVHGDLDGDCTYDPGEVLIAGVTVQLLDSNGNVIGTTTTDINGQYKFENLRPGTYGIREVQPAGYFDGGEKVGSAGGQIGGDDKIIDITLGSGVAAVEYNFCEKLPASIAGFVYADLDSDCTFDQGEAPIAGVMIQLLDAQGNVIGTTYTNTYGEYRFDHLAPGTYGIREIQPAGFFDGGEKVGSAGGTVGGNDLLIEITLGSGVQAVSYNFCEVPPASISGYVFQDGNPIELDDPASELEGLAGQLPHLRNGQRTPDDKPIAGVRIRLTDGTGAFLLDGNGNPIEAITNAKGYYEFDNLPPGLYTVVQMHPDGWIDGLDTAGSAGGLAVNPGILMATPGFYGVNGTDAIAFINLRPGQRSSENNFSEVVVIEKVLVLPTINPPRDPLPLILNPQAQIPNIQRYIAPFLTQMSRPYFYGGGLADGYTWHLSVINAGTPRHVRHNEDSLVQMTGHRFDANQWKGASLDESTWTIAVQKDGELLKEQVNFGMRGSLPITGDFNGDGITDLAVFHLGHWFMDVNGNGRWDDEDLWAKLGARDDKPATGDWDGDGKTDIAIFGKAWAGDPRALEAEPGLPDARNTVTGARKNMPPKPQEAALGLRTMKLTSHGKVRADLIDHVFHYGVGGDHPVSGDWKGSGSDTIGIFRDGRWALDVDGDGQWSDKDLAFIYGQEGDLPVVGDFDGDGIDEIGIFRAGTWFIDSDGNRQLDETDRTFQLGDADDLPAVGDFDGDGRDDFAVFHDGASQAATLRGQAANATDKPVDSE